MRCNHAKTKLSRFLDGELPEGESALLAEHLARCGACAAELASLRGVEPLLRQAAAPPPPAGLTSRILLAARNELARPAAPSSWWEVLRWWPLRMKFAAAATAVLAMYLGLSISGAAGPPAPAGEMAWLRASSQNPVAAAYRGTR